MKKAEAPKRRGRPPGTNSRLEKTMIRMNEDERAILTKASILDDRGDNLSGYIRVAALRDARRLIAEKAGEQ